MTVEMITKDEARRAPSEGLREGMRNLGCVDGA
jgi:hypothetical protein